MANVSLNPYLRFNGNCEEAFSFYAECLGATLEEFHRFGGSPMAGDVPAEHQDKIMHASLNWNGFRLMGSDGCLGRPHEGFRGIVISISVEHAAEAERVFGALSDKGSVTMPIAQTFWAKRFGMLVDRFGVGWMVNCE